ncbi:MAG: response regulator [Syntrophaceae bacterium]|nr:response regulator [Syntrophaceae bacterium]
MNRSKKILLVEDDPNDEELTITSMEKYHVCNDIIVAHDGEEALDYLFRRGKYQGVSGGNPCLVLLDLNLPKVQGLEVLRQIREDEKLKMIPVVVLTSSREDKDLAESYRIGINAYVVKPVDFHEFVEAVKNLATFWCLTNEPPPGSIGKLP